MILIFDTTSKTRVQALLTENGEVLQSVLSSKTRESSAFFLEKTDVMLTAAKRSREELKGIYLAEGAGSFTTVRVSSVIGNALAFGLNIPIEGAFWKRSFTEKDIDKAEEAIGKKRSFTAGYAPQYHHAPNITTPKTVC